MKDKSSHSRNLRTMADTHGLILLFYLSLLPFYVKLATDWFYLRLEAETFSLTTKKFKRFPIETLKLLSVSVLILLPSPHHRKPFDNSCAMHTRHITAKTDNHRNKGFSTQSNPPIQVSLYLLLLLLSLIAIIIFILIICSK